MARLVVPANVAGPVPAVSGERRRAGRRVAPVAAEHGGTADQDLAIVGQLHPHWGDGPADRARAVIRLRRRAGGAALGGAVALHDDDAEVLPGLLQRRRQERCGAHEQAEPAAELTVDAAEQDPADGVGEMAGDPAQALPARPSAGPVDLPLDRAPEQLQDLGHDQHRRHVVIPDGLEDDPRVAAPDVQDVGADGQRVEQGDRLLHEVRQGQERDESVLLGRDGVVGRLDGRHHVGVAEHDALGRSGRAAGEDDLEQVVRPGTWPGGQLRLPVGRPVRVRFGSQLVDGRHREPLQSGLARVWRVPAGAQGEPTRLRRRGDPFDRVRGHPQVERDEHDACPDRPEVDGRHRRCGR